MNIKPELIEKFKMRQTASAENLKSRIGQVLKVQSWETSEYVDVDGVPHTVLALALCGSGEIVRTEVRAFIEKFRAYVDVFGSEEPDDRPLIKIVPATSKKRNEFILFELCDENGNPI